MTRAKKRSRDAEPMQPLPDTQASLAAFTGGDDYFSSGAQKLKKTADNSHLVHLASQHAEGYKELVEEVCLPQVAPSSCVDQGRTINSFECRGPKYVRIYTLEGFSPGRYSSSAMPFHLQHLNSAQQTNTCPGGQNRRTRRSRR